MRSTFILLLCCMCFACAKYPGVPEKYHALLDKALETSGTNQPELAKALESATPEMKEGVAFLISYMPERDLKTMKGDDLLSNVKLAYEAMSKKYRIELQHPVIPVSLQRAFADAQQQAYFLIVVQTLSVQVVQVLFPRFRLVQLP